MILTSLIDPKTQVEVFAEDDFGYQSKRISATYSHEVQEMLESDYDVKVRPQQIIK